MLIPTLLHMLVLVTNHGAIAEDHNMQDETLAKCYQYNQKRQRNDDRKIVGATPCIYYLERQLCFGHLLRMESAKLSLFAYNYRRMSDQARGRSRSRWINTLDQHRLTLGMAIHLALGLQLPSTPASQQSLTKCI